MKFCQRTVVLVAAVMTAGVAFADAHAMGSPDPHIRYATDAYPGFDLLEDLEETVKTPRWFGWINGPKMTNATEQLAWCRDCEAREDWKAALKGYDALVRAWPGAVEAPVAQEALAGLYLDRFSEYENAFAEFRYLADFYSTKCDFDATLFRMYEIAKLMREEGKRILFFRFANTVDVRRAFEAVVVRAPGARYVPEALLTIAELREDEGGYEQAVQAYETIRNLYPTAPEAKLSVAREAKARMQILDDHAYNRPRCLDTIGFLKLSLADGPDLETRVVLEESLAKAVGQLEDEAYKAAKFYDSRTRTKRSAINAYEKFLSEYPASAHADEARRRLEELRGGER